MPWSDAGSSSSSTAGTPSCAATMTCGPRSRPSEPPRRVHCATARRDGTPSQIWLVDLGDPIGREQAGLRPAVVVSDDELNDGPYRPGHRRPDHIDQARPAHPHRAGRNQRRTRRRELRRRGHSTAGWTHIGQVTAHIGRSPKLRLEGSSRPVYGTLGTRATTSTPWRRAASIHRPSLAVATRSGFPDVCAWAMRAAKARLTPGSAVRAPMAAASGRSSSTTSAGARGDAMRSMSAARWRGSGATAVSCRVIRPAVGFSRAETSRRCMIDGTLASR